MVASSSPISYAATKLTYPIFDAEFDPYNRGYLVVAGGGGENRTGVPNKITLLDISSHASISEVAEISLSTEEDSPVSIASLATKQGLITFAGISSSSTDQKAGKNEHFRAFDIEFPPRKRQKTDTDSSTDLAKTEAHISLAGKSSLFKPPTSSKSRVYQRILRLSPVKSRDSASKRIGAIAAADTPENEIVLFDATTFLPNSTSVLARVPTDTEAEDLDIFELAEGEFSLAYCTTTDVYVHRISCAFETKTSKFESSDQPIRFSTPKYGSKRPKLRSIRWLGPNHVILLQNGSPGGSPELIVVCVNKDPKSGPATLRYRLPGHVGMGVRLDVCPLDANPANGERQIVIAAAAQDKTIHILTCTHQPSMVDEEKQIVKLSPYSILDTSHQHPQSISKVVFSNFYPPRQPKDSNTSVASETQYIYLASGSVGWTVSVEALALTSIPIPPSSTGDADDEGKGVRWVLSTGSSEFLKSWYGIVTITAIVLATAVFLQYYMNSVFDSRNNTVRSPGHPVMSHSSSRGVPVAESATSAVSEASSIASSIAESVVASPEPKKASDSHGSFHRVRDLFHRHREHVDPDHPENDAEMPKKAILVRPGSDNPFSNEIHADVNEDVEGLRAKGAKRFHELPKHEQEAWKEKLSAAGKWSSDEGDTILKSVLFSQWAEIVGGAIRDAIV